MAGSQSAIDYLTSLKSRRPDVAELVNGITDDYRKRLWHQLTSKIEDLVRRPTFADELVQFYTAFLSTFETKLNPLSFAKIAVEVSRHPDEYLKTVADKIGSKDFRAREGRLLAVSERGLVLLRARKLEDCQALLEDAKKEADSLSGADSVVFAAYYLVQAEYEKLKGTPANFYKNALLYLAYANVDSLPLDFKKRFAFDLILAALIGEGVYMFGDLPILKSLQGTDVEWLVHVLQAFNSGNLKEWNALAQKYSKQLSAQPDLVKNEAFLGEKIAILALMELVFTLPSHQRTIPFKTVAQATQVSPNEVELLVMKALSLGLIKGHVDEVDQTVTLTWVQPRVLLKEQIGSMTEKLKTWNEQVFGTLRFLEGETPELFA